MRARFVDECDPSPLVPYKRVAQARGKFQSRSTTTDDNDFVKWYVLGCLVKSHARIEIVRCSLKHFGHSQSGTYRESVRGERGTVFARLKGDREFWTRTRWRKGEELDFNILSQNCECLRCSTSNSSEGAERVRESRDQRCRQGARKRRTPVLLCPCGGPKWDAVPSGARGCLFAGARTRRWARSHGRSRIDRRRLFWRTETNHRSRQRPEARDRYAGLRHL